MESYILAKSFVKENSTMWRVFVWNGEKSEHLFFFNEPIKAMKYCYILQKQLGVKISKKSIAALSAAYKEVKNA